jgi:hypothetical protein
MYEDLGATRAGLETSYLTKELYKLRHIMVSYKVSMGTSGRFEAE